jgi:hypothetical protein
LNPTHPAYDAELKASWKSLSKKERQQLVDQDQLLIRARHESVAGIAHPFTAEPDDHCETDLKAYEDIACVLKIFCEHRHTCAAKLRIYDPYFCTGRVVEHMASLGFADVYNKCEDFYAVAARHATPECDIVVTNPAYSGEHIPRMLRILTELGKPFCLLMPAYVADKEYFASSLGPLRGGMLYLQPHKRYVYWTPRGLRSKLQSHASALGSRTSPFVSFWYIHPGPDAALGAAILKLRSDRFRILECPVKPLPVAGVKRHNCTAEQAQDCREASVAKRRR